MKIIAGLLSTTSGSIAFNGRSIINEKPNERIPTNGSNIYPNNIVTDATYTEKLVIEKH